MSVRKYTILFTIFSLMITASLALINYIVDPYMLFHSQRIAGFNDKKPAAANQSVLYKPYHVVRIRPQTVIVGNSRPEMGIDPESSCWPDESGTVYNFTFPGLGTYAQVRSLFHAVATDQVQHILLAVDFADFLYSRAEVQQITWPKNNSGFFNRLLVDEIFEENNGNWLQTLQDYTSALFSLKALNDSVFTIFLQSPHSTDRTPLGFSPARDFQEIVQREGAWVLFEQKLNELSERFSEAGQSIYDSGQWSLELESIKRAIQLAIEKNIRLTLFINPYHFTYLEAIQKAGYWHEFENFKKSLHNLVKQYDKAKVELWDFSLYSEYTVSAIPRKGEKNQIPNWFWEPAHYKAELGDRMLADIFEKNCTIDHKASAGVKLNGMNIERHLTQQQMRRTELLQQIDVY